MRTTEVIWLWLLPQVSMQQVDFKCNNDGDVLFSVRCVTVVLQIARAHGRTQREGERGIGMWGEEITKILQSPIVYAL